jgi:hypothetical protein
MGVREFRKRTVVACIAAIVAAQIGRASAEDKLLAEAAAKTVPTATAKAPLQRGHFGPVRQEETGTYPKDL